MKKMIFILMLMMATTLSTEAHRYSTMHVTISMQTFYNELSPYGDWIYTNDYGYVWRPFFDNPYAFRPYSSGGNWVYTEYGWTWVSDYRWGWATFHYGRWYFDDYLGWMWIPGYEWAPAWVSWGNYGDYYGWAPLGPNIYVSVNFNWLAPDPWWTFVPRRYFRSNNWRHYIYNRPVQVNNITYINNVYYNDNRSYKENNWFQGPRVSDVERYGNTRVRQMKVLDTEKPNKTLARNGEVTFYRPSVDRTRNDSRPTELSNAENVRSSTRITQDNPRSNDPGANRTREEMKSSTRSTRNYNAVQNPATREQTGNRNATEVKSQSRNDGKVNSRSESTINDNRSSGNTSREATKENKTTRSNEASGTTINRQESANDAGRNSTEVKSSRSESKSEAPKRVTKSDNKVERKQAKSSQTEKASRNSSSTKSSGESSGRTRNR
jgi:hypothetical protein